MSRKLQPIDDKAEFKRLKVRAGKYLDYALRHKKKNAALITSTALFVEGERQRAVDDWKRHHRTYPQPLTRWMHFRKAVWK